MDIIKSVLPVLVMIALGMLMRSRKLITAEGISGMQSLVMNITLPAVLFGAFYNTSISADSLILPLILFVLVTAGVLLGRPISRLLKLQGSYAPFLLSGYEAGMLGYALMAILAKNGDISSFALMDVGHSLAIFTVYLALLKGAGGEKQSLRQSALMLIKTPVLVAILLGVLFSVTGLGRLIAGSAFGPTLDSLLSFISAPTGAVILLVIGFRMDFRELDWLPVLKICGVRIVLQALFAAAALGLTALAGGRASSPEARQALLLMLILPPPFIIPLYAEGEREKTFASSVLSVFTLVSVVCFVVLVACCS